MRLYGKDKPLETLERFYSSGRMPHGIIFTGDKGVGKTALSSYTAKMLVCENGGVFPCNACNSCIKADNKTHPDIIYVKNLAEKEKYNVELMRTVIKESVRRPNDGNVKVYIFQDCENMSAICQNTLLKFIEEPLQFNRFVFTASSVETVLETVISRLTRIEVSLPVKNESKYILIDSGASESEAEDIISRYGVNPAVILEAYKNIKSDGENDIDYAFNITKNIITGIIKKSEYAVVSAFALIRDRDMLNKTLVLLLSVFRDALIYKCGQGDLTGYCKESSMILAGRCGLKELTETQDLILLYLDRLEQNPNHTLACPAYAGGICSAIIK